MISQKAFAKINLILKVLNKRSDNYHNIFSLIHKVSLFDVITILPNKKNIEVECSVDLRIPQEENIVYKAAKTLLEYTKNNDSALIKIDKNIPTGAGLGGGSSDAATTLNLLNQFWNLNLSMKTLRSIAITLGSDVPFFLESYPKWVYGMGEHYEVLDLIDIENNIIKRKHIDANALIIYPKIHIDTGTAYKKLNRQIENIDVNDDTYLEHIIQYENQIEYYQKDFLRNALENDFEKIIFEDYPEIAEIYKDLEELSNRKPLLTGSGSAVFAIFTDKNKVSIIDFIKRNLKQKYKKEGKDYLIFRTRLVP